MQVVHRQRKEKREINQFGKHFDSIEYRPALQDEHGTTLISFKVSDYCLKYKVEQENLIPLSTRFLNWEKVKHLPPYLAIKVESPLSSMLLFSWEINSSWTREFALLILWIIFSLQMKRYLHFHASSVFLNCHRCLINPYSVKKPSCSPPHFCGCWLSASAPLLLTLILPCKLCKFLHFWNFKITFYICVLWESFHAWLSLFTFSLSDLNGSNFIGVSDSAERDSLSPHN